MWWTRVSNGYTETALVKPNCSARNSSQVRFPSAWSGATLAPARCARAAWPGSQIFHRARRALQDNRARFEPEKERQRQLVLSFLSASQAGNMEALTSLLAQDTVSWSDGGGKVQTNFKPIYGKLAVARFWSFWLSGAYKNQRPLTMTLAEINGSPAILCHEEGRLVGVISVHLSTEGIQEIYAQLNPEKLTYLQKQLSSSSKRSQF